MGSQWSATIHLPPGIGYLKVLFDTSRVPVQDLPYVGLLKAVLGYVDTARHTYGDLSSEIFLNSGGVSFSVTAFPDLKKRRLYRTVCASVRVLYEKLDFGFEILKEILTESILEDEKRLQGDLKRGEIQEPDAAHELWSYGRCLQGHLLFFGRFLLQRDHSRHRLFPVCGAVGTGV